MDDDAVRSDRKLVDDSDLCRISDPGLDGLLLVDRDDDDMLLLLSDELRKASFGDSGIRRVAGVSHNMPELACCPGSHPLPILISWVDVRKLGRVISDRSRMLPS